jgi:tellurium resistance protein TerD
MPIINQVWSATIAPMNQHTIRQMKTKTQSVVTKNSIMNLMTQTTPLKSVLPQRTSRNFGNGALMNKGQKMSLDDATNIEICAGWEIKDARCDVDISAFMLDSTHKIVSDEWFVFYGQTNSPDNSLKLNCNGTADDNKCISANLTKVSNEVSRIVFVLTIYDAETEGLNFSMIDNAYIRILNDGIEIIRFILNDYYDTVTSMMLGELYRHNGKWKFNAIGDGVKKDLAGLCEMYGVQTE